MSIPFHIPHHAGRETQYLEEVIGTGRKLSGDGPFTKRCHHALSELTTASKVLLTTSCTHALEMAALLVGIEPNDEVIMPSFTFVSSANPFVLRGARVRFVDVDPVTMNIDASLVEAAITPRTRAIVVVHYAGVACDMPTICAVAERHGLYVIEDAAQAIDASLEGRPLGTWGHLGTLSFHDTKNIHCGEGGALLVNDARFADRAEVLREKGTNRSRFLRGEVDKYSWVSEGSSYLPSELNAAYLLAQIENVRNVTSRRLALWQQYHELLAPLDRAGVLCAMRPPGGGVISNAHIYFVKLQDIEARQRLIDELKRHDIHTAFHYVPLHSAEAGLKYSTFHGVDRHTTTGSEQLLRLPLYDRMRDEDVSEVAQAVMRHFDA